MAGSAPVMASTAIIALLVLLAAPARAGRPWLDSDFARTARSLLTSAASFSGTTCPAGYIQPPETPPAVPAFTDPATNGATFTWQQLRDAGWDLPATRPTTAEWYSTYADTPYSSTFWSLQCNGRGFVSADGRGCITNAGTPTIDETKTFGATHVRYNCTTQSFWVLTYAFDGEDFEATGKWATTCVTTASDLGTCAGGGTNKFLQIADSVASPQDAACDTGSKCTAADPPSNYCCQDMWAIVDAANNWIGWMGQARFQLPAGTTTSYAQIQTHWNSGEDTTTAVNGQNLTRNGLCFTCGGSPPPPEENCIPFTATITSPGSLSVCSDATERLLTYSFVATAKKVNVTVSPANCVANVTEVPAGGGGVLVNCSAPWSDSSFTVSLTLEGECEVLVTDELTVTVDAKPTVTVTLEQPDNFICSTDETAVYTLRVSSDVLPASPADLITVAITNDAANACSFTDTEPPATTGTVPNDTLVSVTCSKPTPNGWSTSLGFTLEASAGTTGCSHAKSAAASTSVTPEPDVSVEINEASVEEKCDADQDGVTLTATVYNYRASEAKMSVGASLGNVACTVTPDTEVANATEVTVTCAMPGTGYVAGTYTLTVSAQAGVEGCSDNGSDTATLTVNAKPTVVITGPTTGQVCEDEQSFSFTYGFASSPEGALVNLTAPSQCNNFTYTSAGGDIVNTATANSIPAGDVTILCDKGADILWTGSTFNAEVTAAAGTTGCTNSTQLTNAVTIDKRPNIEVTIPPKVTHCSTGQSGVFSFNVTGLAGFESTAVFTPDWSRQFAELNCSQVTQGPGTLYQVTCTTTAPTLPVRFNLTLAVTAGATSSCSDASSATTEAYVPCCGGGEDTAYASVGVGNDTTLRSAASNSKCFYAAGEDWSSCGNPNGNWGWRNRFSGEGTVDAAIFAGAAVTCKKTTKRVGTITASCANSGSDSLVTFTALDNLGISPRDNHIYVGCAAWMGSNIVARSRSPTCSPSTFGGVTRPTGNSTTIVTCGGNESAMRGVGRCGGPAIPTSFGGFRVPGCNCENVYFIFHQADGDWRYARQADGSCSLPN